MLMPWCVCQFFWQVLMFGWKPKYFWFESRQKIHSVTRLRISIKKEKRKTMDICDPIWENQAKRKLH